MADGLVTIVVELQDGSVVKGVANINKGMLGLEQAGGRAGKSMIGFGAVTGAAMALAQKGLSAVTNSVGAAVDRFDTLNQYPKVMKQMGYSTKDTSKSIDIMKKGIDGLPTTLPEITKMSQNFATLTGSATKGSKSAVALSHAFLASGASAADASRGTQQFSQMLASGKVDMQSWQSLQETMPYALDKTAKAMGFTGKAAKQDLYKALQDGDVTMDQFLDKIIELDQGVDGFGETAKLSSKGIKTSFQNMNNAIVAGLADMLKAIDDALKSAGLNDGIATIFDEMKSAIVITFTSLNSFIKTTLPPIIMAMKEMFDFVANNKDWLVPLTIGVGGTVGSLKLLIAVMKTFNQTQELMLAFRGMQMGAKGAGDAFAVLSREGGLVARSLSGVLQAKQLVPVLWGVARGSTAAQSALVILAQHSTMAAGASKLMGAALAVPVWGWIAAAVIGVVSALTYFIAKTETGQKIWHAFTSWFMGIWDGMKSAVMAFANWYIGIWKSIISAGQTMWQAFSDWFGNSWESAKSGYTSFSGWFVTAWGQMADSSKSIWSEFSSWSSTVFAQAMSAIQTALVPVQNALNTFGTFVGRLATSFGQFLTSIAPTGGVFASMNGPLGTAVGLITKFAPLIITLIAPVGLVAKLFLQFASALLQTGDASSAITLMADNFTSMVTGVLNGLTTMIETITAVLPQVIETGVDIIIALINGIVSALPQIIEAMTQVIEMITNVLADVLPQLVEAGIQILESLVQGIVNALPVLIGAALMLITTLAQGLLSAYGLIIQAGLDIVSKLFEAIIQALPTIIEAGIQIISKLIEAVSIALPTLLEAGIQIVTGLFDAIVQALPMLIEAGILLLTTLINAVISMLPMLIEMALSIIMALVNALIENLPLIIDAGIQLIMALVNAIITLLPVIIEAAIKIVRALIQGLINNLPQIINAGIKLIMALAGAIITLVPLLLQAGVKLIAALIRGVLSLIGSLLGAGGQLISGLIGAIVGFIGNMVSSGAQLISGVIDGIAGKIGNVVSTVSGGISDAVAGVQGFAGDMFNAAADLANGLVNGITSKIGEVVDAAKNMAKGAVDGAKSFLGIHSPSRVFRDQVGKFIPEGLAVGIDRNARVAISSMESLSDKISSIKPEPVFDMGAMGGFTTANGIIEHQLSRNASGSDDKTGNVANVSVTNYVQENPSEAEQTRLMKNTMRQMGYDLVY